ncbi:hypothetical protein [Devosia lacusdianchii]|uniref:hypothetical protein n=1 Tax=Devosia lacusdianchii TaxID=2917991 RepID=UPI001F05AA7A|nr:hypothetical protein [Devosia sp. JXJ CY 41]
MTILSTTHSSRIRNRSMGVLHLIAADESCEVSDILALLIPEPRPTSTPAVQAHIVADASDVADERPTSLPGADGAVDRAPHPQAAVDADLEEAEKAIIVETGKSVGEQSPAAPASFRDQLRSLHQSEPELTRPELAARLGKSHSYVTAAVREMDLDVPTTRVMPDPPREKAKAKPLPAPSGFTLKERIRTRYRQHPTHTARMIANELGANPGIVSAVLATVRKEEAGQDVESVPAPTPANILPNQPAGSIEARLKADAAARKARLGGKA